MLEEMKQAIWRLHASGLSSSQAANDLRQLHDRYADVLQRVQDSSAHPHVMRILAEEAVEGLCGRFQYLGIPMGNDHFSQPVPLYWRNYLQAVNCGELLDIDYVRFQQALLLTDPFLNDSYVEEESIQGDYKVMRYAYALSNLAMPEWFSPPDVMNRLEEIVTACGFLWFAVVDYAEEQFIMKGA